MIAGLSAGFGFPVVVRLVNPFSPLGPAGVARGVTARITWGRLADVVALGVGDRGYPVA
jgi:hypothetical protein